MIKKIRQKFVLVTMCLLLSTFGLILLADSLYSRYWDEQETLDILHWYANSNIISDTKSSDTELIDSLMNPIFSVSVNSDFDIISIKSSNPLSEEPSAETVSHLLQSPKDSHRWKSYIYIVDPAADGYMLTVTDVSEGKREVYRTLGNTMVIAVGAAALFIITLVLSRFVTEPAEKALEREKQFISDASHELKTPLAAISINAQALQSETKDNKYIQYILSETHRMDTLIQKLLKLSHLDEVGGKIEKREFSLSNCCDEMTLTMESVIYENRVQLIYHIDENIRYVGNESNIKQLLSILFDNAIKHTPEKGLIEIKLTAHGQHPIFTITNSGSGISEDDLPHIFERFYRTDESRNGNSYGLGLAIAKSIVFSHGADISVKSEVGKSTCFTITF